LNTSKKKGSSTSNINKPNDINRGVQFILLNGRKKKNGSTFQITFPGGKKMEIDTEILLSLLLPVSLLFFFVGLLGGWVARDYMMNYREVPRPHPEMFDIHGNLVPDEVIAFNFENYHDDNESTEEDN
jgi:hypothetical protein